MMRIRQVSVGRQNRRGRGKPKLAGASAGIRAATIGASSKPGPAFYLLITLWVLSVYAPQWFLASKGLSPVLKLPLLLYAVLGAMLAFMVPTNAKWARRWKWHTPFLLFIVLGWLAMPFSPNAILAYEAMKEMTLYWLLIVGTVAVIDSPRRAEQLLLLYGLQYVWWGIWGGANGLVPWHTVWANYDGYGAMMVGGIGITFFLFASSKERWFRRAMSAAMALCAVGVVASFARGAFLGAAGLLGIIWLRSPKKGKTFALGMLTVGVMAAAAAILHPGTFWAEIQSTFTEGTSSGTGEDRWILWGAAVQVWAQHPFLGVGPDNFGPFAARFFQPGDLEGLYGINPGRLFDRSLHSMWVQFLADRGVVGMFLWLWVLHDFWRRNGELRQAKAQALWAAAGGRLELGSVALALEASMVAFLVTAAFYSLISTPWLYTLLALNLMLHGVVTRTVPLGAPSPSVRPPRRNASTGGVALGSSVAHRR